MASRFTRKGVQVYAIGVGRARRGELRSIAYKNKHVYYMRTFGSMVARANQIAAAICSEQVRRIISYCKIKVTVSNTKSPSPIACYQMNHVQKKLTIT